MAERIIGVDKKRRLSMPLEGTTCKRIKNRFRAIVRSVIYNLPWLTGKMKKQSAITDELRTLLLKRVAYRTQEELQTIYHLLSNYKFFRKYPEEAEQKLASSMYYYYVPAGKTIIRQGDPGFAMYFILTGECRITIESKDPYTDEIVESDPVILTHGNVFGEVALLHHIPRTGTVRSKSEVELLRLSGDDFDEILKENLELEWNRIKAAMNQFPYFYYWTEIDVREFCILASIVKYAPNDIVLGNESNDYNYSYFILSGTCQLIQSLPLIANLMKKGTNRLRVRLDDNEQLKSYERLEIVFLQVCIFHRGSTLSIGENMKDRQVIATSEVSCLRCPRYWLLQYNRGNLWSRIEHFLNRVYPSRQKLFNKLIKDRNWAQYCKQLVEPIYSRAASNPTTIHDVPMFIRVHEKIKWDHPGFRIRRRIRMV